MRRTRRTRDRIHDSLFRGSIPKGFQLALLRTPLLHFLILGGLLFALESLSARVSAKPVVEIRARDVRAEIERFEARIGRAPDAQERAALVDQVVAEALWLEEARALGLAQDDPIVRRRLLMNMRFLEDDAEATDAALLARARALGMARSDPVVRRRLVDRMRARVRASVERRPVDEAELVRHHREHADRWREPGHLDLTHVYLSRDRRGERLEGDAKALLTRLRRGDLAPEDAADRGDPFLVGNRFRAATPSRLVARFGPAFEAGVRAAPIGRWIGPIESAFGLHAVWIHAREPERVPPLEAIRDRVLADWREAEVRRAWQAHVARRRAAVELRAVADRAPAHGSGAAARSGPRRDSARPRPEATPAAG